MQLNPLLTAITLPTSSQNVTIFIANDCNLTGTLNLSSLSNLSGNLQLQNNALLTAITLPSNASSTWTLFACQATGVTSINFTACPKLTEVNGCNIQIQSNGMTAAQLNQMLIDLDTNATNGFTGRSITANGSNAAPTGLGLVAKTSLTTKGFTVTTN